jgi:hypothetical protein
MLFRSISQSQNLPGPVTVEKTVSFPFLPRSVVPRRFRSPFFGLVVLGAVALLFRLCYSSGLSRASLPVPVSPTDLLINYIDGTVSPTDRKARSKLTFPRLGSMTRSTRLTSLRAGSSLSLRSLQPSRRSSAHILHRSLVRGLADKESAFTGTLICLHIPGRRLTSPVPRAVP